MTFFSLKTSQYTYFSQQLDDDDWRGKDILDFGGNIGNMLRDVNSTIDESRYWCLDIDREAVEKGREAFPAGHWIFYNRHCFFFNPQGLPDLPIPDLQQRFDYIVAYSVFSNTSQSDMLDLVGQLRTRLKPDGKLTFSFIDPHFHSWPNQYHGNNLQWRLEKDNRDKPHVEITALLEKAHNARWCILVNGTDLYVETEEIGSYSPEEQTTHHTFFSADYMKMLFPDATVLPPTNDEMQHCCILSQ